MGDVDSVALRVLANVPDDVRQLQRDAHVHRVIRRARVFVSEHFDARQADGGRHLIAVIAQLGEIGEARLGQVVFHAFQYAMEMLAGYRESLGGARQGDELRLERGGVPVAGQRGVQIAPNLGERETLALGRLVAVRYVVAQTAIGVSGVNRAPLLAGERPKGDVEILGSLAGDPLAVVMRLV